MFNKFIIYKLFYFYFLSTNIHTKTTPTTQSLKKTSNQNNYIIINLPTYTTKKTTPQQTPKYTPTKTQIQTLNKSPNSYQKKSYINTNQTSPFQKLKNPKIKSIKTNPTSPLQKINHAKTKTNKIYKPQNNDN